MSQLKPKGCYCTEEAWCHLCRPDNLPGEWVGAGWMLPKKDRCVHGTTPPKACEHCSRSSR